MLTFTRRFGVAALVAGALFGASEPPAHGQAAVRGNPALRTTLPIHVPPTAPRVAYPNVLPARHLCNVRYAGYPCGYVQGPVPAVPYTGAVMTSVPAPSSPYPYGPYADAFGGYLHGGADVIRAQGEFLKDIQRSGVIHEERRKAQIENRYREFEYRRYAEANTPSLQDRRDQHQLQELRRALANPPTTEIHSAYSLNVLLAAAQAHHRAGQRGLEAPLSEEVLRHINLTTGGGGHLGLLKEGRLHWPEALREPACALPRYRVEELIPSAVHQARSRGQVDAGTLRTLADSVEQLRTHLAGKLPKLEFAAHRDAKTFLQHLDEAVRALGQKDVGAIFAHQDALRGKTVGRLVRYMTEHGLKFATAVDGDRRAYEGLHEALAAYVAQATLVANRGS